MSYTLAALLGVAGALLVDLAVLRTRLVFRRVFWATYPIILFFQLLSNGVLAGRAVVRYDPEAIVGPRVAYAPVEDLGFGFALVLVTLSVWVWLGRRGSSDRLPPVSGRPGPLLASSVGDGQPPMPSATDHPTGEGRPWDRRRRVSVLPNDPDDGSM